MHQYPHYVRVGSMPLHVDKSKVGRLLDSQIIRLVQCVLCLLSGGVCYLAVSTKHSNY